MWGIIVNVLSIFLVVHRISSRQKITRFHGDTIMHGLSLAICLIGIKMALSTPKCAHHNLSCVISGS